MWSGIAAVNASRGRLTGLLLKSRGVPMPHTESDVVALKP
jgi:hypothetical protein